MLSAASLPDLASVLPGTWNVRATNFPMWLGGDRLAPSFTYELQSSEPLVLGDDVSFFTPDGVEKHIVGVDRWAHEGFTWRGRKLLKLFASHWTVIGASADASVLAIRFEKTLATPAGIDIIVRDGVELDELRPLIAGDTESFGLSPEDFASLTWLAPVDLESLS